MPGLTKMTAGVNIHDFTAHVRQTATHSVHSKYTNYLLHGSHKHQHTISTWYNQSMLLYDIQTHGLHAYTDGHIQFQIKHQVQINIAYYLNKMLQYIFNLIHIVLLSDITVQTKISYKVTKINVFNEFGAFHVFPNVCKFFNLFHVFSMERL